MIVAGNHQQFKRQQVRGIPQGRLTPPIRHSPYQQAVMANRSSSFLSFPNHIAQQRIPNSLLGLGNVHTTPISGPTIQWPTSRTSFAGNVIYGSKDNIGLSGDPQFLSKGVDLLLHRETGNVFCPVCLTNYPTGALEEHIKRHQTLNQITEKTEIKQNAEAHRQSALLSHAGLSPVQIQRPLIVQPAEVEIEEVVNAPVSNFIIVDNTTPQSLALPPQISRHVEIEPLQYPIERSNLFSCCDGLFSRDRRHTAREIISHNEWIARTRPVHDWSANNYQF